MLNTVENKVNASFKAASGMYAEFKGEGFPSPLIVWAINHNRFLAFPKKTVAQEWADFHQCPLSVCDERGICIGEVVGE